jgi:hypothetical protein
MFAVEKIVQKLGLFKKTAQVNNHSTGENYLILVTPYRYLTPGYRMYRGKNKDLHSTSR